MTDKIVVDLSTSSPPSPEALQQMRLEVLQSFEEDQIDAEALQRNLEQIKEMEESASSSEPEVVPLTDEEEEQLEMDRQESREHAVAQKRAWRNGILRDTDWTQIQDTAVPESKRQEWRAYRQNLRDTDFSDPDNVEFPEPPQ